MSTERKDTAAGLVGPATVYVAIGLLVPLAFLFRYSLNQFVPGKFMVDALTIENYVKFFTDIYYTAVLTRTVRVALVTTRSACCSAFRSPTCWRARRCATRTC
jgi:putative spermidine/putrescine transport system permease protein